MQTVKAWPAGGGSKTPAAPKWDVLGTILMTLGLLLVAAAITLGAYPLLSSIRGEMRANDAFTSEMETASVYDQAVVDELISEAESYNAMLAGTNGGDYGSTALYDQQLDYNNSHIFCWLDIPSLNIKMPVYRDDGTEEVSVNGAEHVRGTSLPVGGVPSNCVITAHSGSHEGTSMMFNKLDLIEHDAIIILWTLGRPYAYRVTGWEQTQPEETDNLLISGNTDQLTLLTCRPIGTTAKRLFVHCVRTDYVPEMAQSSRIELLAEPDFPQFVGSLVGGGILLWIILLLAWRKKTAWYLNRIIDKESRGFTEEDIARIVKNTDENVAELQLKWFRRARLVMFGGQLKGKWRRVKDDRSCIIVEFEHDAMGDSWMRTAEGYPDYLMERGEFVVQGLDGEIALYADYHNATLVFSKERPKEDDGDDGNDGNDGGAPGGSAPAGSEGVASAASAASAAGAGSVADLSAGGNEGVGVAGAASAASPVAASSPDVGAASGVGAATSGWGGSDVT